MGVFFYTHSVALIEDIGLEEEYKTEADLIRDMDTGYEQVIYLFLYFKPTWGDILLEVGVDCTVEEWIRYRETNILWQFVYSIRFFKAFNTSHAQTSTRNCDILKGLSIEENNYS